MTDHVYLKFPNHFYEIQRLLQHSTAFREMCDDYEEICTWLASHERTKRPPTEECEHARELVRELEDEIDNILKGERA